MTKLEKLIAAIQCPEYSNKVCMNCPYDYQIELEDDDRPRHSYYDCNRVSMLNDALVYLKTLKDMTDLINHYLGE